MLMELDVVPPQPSKHPGVALAESDLRMPPFLKGHAVEESRGRYPNGALAVGSVNNGGGGGGGGMTEDAMRALNNMLWTVYLMMVENDGLNERQLHEYARVDGWLRAFWFEEGGASCARLAIRDDAWPPNNDFRAVTMWLLWFLRRLDDYFVLDEAELSNATTILKLLALGAHEGKAQIEFIASI
ncbi:hypothetical protein EDB84DRAFT_1444517 [Lactarius hengduanensis]|nr:hypothetical protein EDB84DRAFT_1444517 [Lactarius hengduanensis]